MNAADADNYQARAAGYAGELADLPTPRLLDTVLGESGLRVVEAPSGTGHYLPHYARAGARLTLADVCPQMITTALRHAEDSGVFAPAVACTLIEDLDSLITGVDLLVIPNAAINQLAAQPGRLIAVLSAAHRALAPAGTVYIQALCRSGTRVPACRFYDLAAPHRCWFPDRVLPGGGVRRRWQERTGDRLSIGFRITTPAGVTTEQHVDLRVLTVARLAAAARRAELRITRTLPDAVGGLSELTATPQVSR